MKKIQNYINGRLQDALSGKWLDNYNPATGDIYSFIPDSDSEDIELAVEAASMAFPGWSSTPAEKRSQIMLKIASMIESRMTELTEAECLDNGKPLWLARAVDIPRARDNFKFFATAILHEANEAHQTDHTAINYTYYTIILNFI